MELARNGAQDPLIEAAQHGTAIPTKGAHSGYKNGTGVGNSSFINDEDYRSTVLKLQPGDTEESTEESLLDEARQLELVPWDADGPLSQFFEISPSHNLPPTSNSTSVRPPSTANNSTLHVGPCSSSTVVSSKDKVSSSRHSITSSSTCPTLCSCNERRSNLSGAEKPHSRYSLDPARFSASSSLGGRPGSKDMKLKFDFKHALMRFPFKKRGSNNFTTPSRASTCPECHALPASGSTSHENHQTNGKTQESIHPFRCFLGSTDEAAVTRSAQSSQLLEMRSAHKEQRDRHLAFAEGIVEQMASVHRGVLGSQLYENQKAERDLSDRNTQKAARSEENQLSAEFSLVEDFKREKSALQSAIRHMEAYFNSPAPFPEDSPIQREDNTGSQRQYTQEQKDRLQQKYHERDSIDSLHESKIKVLRDRQAKKYDEILKKLDRENKDLVDSNAQVYRDLRKRCQAEETATLAWLESKKKRSSMRWILEESILRKKLELENDVIYGALPVLSFEDLRV